jgi:hypothetical protein
MAQRFSVKSQGQGRRRNGRARSRGWKEEMEERRTNKEKSSVLGFRIILCIFPMCQSPIGCCKTKLLQMYRITGFPLKNYRPL